jgi:hypothetical protein
MRPKRSTRQDLYSWTYGEAIKAFDELQLRHGFTLEELQQKNEALIRSGCSDLRRWNFFIALCALCEKQVRKRVRKEIPRNPFEIFPYYSVEEIQVMIKDNARIRKLAQIPVKQNCQHKEHLYSCRPVESEVKKVG